MDEKIRLDLGCWDSKKKGFLGVDMLKGPTVDIVHDLTTGIPYKDEEVDEIYTSHFLEHVPNPEFLIKEIYRVLKKGSKATIIIPHFTNPGAYTPLHKTYWSYSSIDKKILKYYMDCDFKSVKVRLNSRILPKLGVNKIVNVLVNISPMVYERYLRLVMVDEIIIDLVK